MLQLHDDLIYDIGANNGDDTAYYLFRGYKVLAIEADVTLMDRLNTRFAAEVARGQLQVLNVALAPTRSVAKFYICEGYSLWNSFDRETASRMGRTAHAVDVECWPLRELLARHGVPHYLKLSLHGEEHFCLADLDPEVSPTYISLELPRDLTLSEQVFSRLGALGYGAAKIIDQTKQKQLLNSSWAMVNQLNRMMDRHPRVQAAVDAGRRLLGGGGDAAEAQKQAWVFPEGSSGPFGEETDGDWRATAAAWTEWSRFLKEQSAARGVNLSVWHDLHVARRAPPAG